MKNLESNFSNISHSFWDSWKEFSETNSKQYVDIQDGNKWENFYKNLLSNKINKSVPPTQPSPLNLDLNKPSTLSELKKSLKSLKRKKVIGFDRISNEMIQNAPHLYIDLILKMFNKILILGHVPKEWCCGLITPIYKKGIKLDPDNYRGICVMNALLKVLCLIMNQRLQAFLTKNNTIDKAQIGFMSKSRTTDHIFTLKTLCN